MTDPATLGIAAAVALGVWLLVLASLAVATRARDPDPAQATMELGGDEPPAVVNLITNDWAVGKAAVPATLIDLAARKAVGIELAGSDHCVVRVPQRAPAGLTPYEEQVYDHVRGLASGGIVPGEALTTGPEGESKSWWKRFRTSVVDDARRRGLSRPRWARGHVIALGILGTAPAGLAAGAFVALPSSSSSKSDDGSGAVFGFFGLAVVLWMALMVILGSLRAERDTPAGLAAASRWLGLRRHLAGDEHFAEQPPAAVALWDRLLSYGAAMGVAAGAVRALPMGAESEKEAWTSYGGRWRVVHVHYPHRFPPGWGRSPWAAIGIGLAWAIPAALVVYGTGSLFSDAVGDVGDVFAGGAKTFGAVAVLVFIAAPLAALAYGLSTLSFGAADVGKRAQVEGVVLRRKEVVSSNDSGSHTTAVYLAVYDGQGAEVRALRCTPDVASGMHAGSVVRASLTPHLGHVYELERLPG